MSKQPCEHKYPINFVGQTNTPIGAQNLYECSNCGEEFVLEPLEKAQSLT